MMTEKFISYGIPEGWDIRIEAGRMHDLNHRWWHDINTGERLKLNWGERLMLVITEIAEAAEGFRTNKQDDHLPKFLNEQVEVCDALIRLFDLRHGYGFGHEYVPIEYCNEGITDGNVMHALATIVGDVDALRYLVYQAPDEMYAQGQAIDCIITALFNYAAWRGFLLTLRDVYEAKVSYNTTRIDHTIEHRRGIHGKKI